MRQLGKLAEKAFPLLEKWIELPVNKADRAAAFDVRLASHLVGIADTSREVEYLICKLTAASFVLLAFLFAFLLVDLGFSLNLLIDPALFSSSPQNLTRGLRNISFAPVLMLTAIFYIRIRFSIDLAKTHIIVQAHPAYLDDEVRSNWVVRSSIVLIAAFLLLPGAHLAAEGALQYTKMEENRLAAVFVTALLAFVIGSIPPAFIIHALLVEKAYKYFEDFKIQLKELVRERDSKTDKYKKKKSK